MNHPTTAAAFTKDFDRTTWHDQALWFVRQKRDKAVYAVPGFQTLRTLASQIKEHTLSHLDEYLLEFERQATQNGATVLWAEDGKAHNQIVLDIIKKYNGKAIVKSKSMLTEECHLNPFLEQHGYDITDTDLGERIVQFRKEPPSHIVLPAIHLKKEDVGQVFHQHLGTPKNENDPQRLTEAARQHLREKFLQADIAITGANFAVAETGSIVVCTNEGNADMGTNLAKVHIVCLGIEKIIPKTAHLGVFTRLLARSATGQAITSYTSHFTKPRDGASLYIVFVDNGRAKHLNQETFRNGLKCIRCGACLNTCPVYRRSGGHSYGYTIPGPIGSILSPGVDPEKHKSLPFASTLCGSCTDVCPVKIDLHQQLYAWRQVLAKNNALSFTKKMGMKIGAYILSNSWRYRTVGKILRLKMRYLPFLFNIKALNPWVREREMPKAPKESFQEWYRKNKT